MLRASLFFLIVSASIVPAAEEGFRPLFNGKDLAGWDGNPQLWSVQDGCITGKTTGPETLEHNQFLIWRGGVLKNFELRVKLRQSGNNSGIQYRSKERAGRKWSVSGYQCDIHSAPGNCAMIYEEGGRGIFSQNGQSLVIDPRGQRWLVRQREPAGVDVAQWHVYTIIAEGNHIRQFIDGNLTVDLVDHEEAKRSLEGILAFQLHRGPAMTVQIAEVLLKELPGGGVSAFDKSTLPAEARMVEKPAPKAKARAGRAAGPPASAPGRAMPASLAERWKWLWSAAEDAKQAARFKTEFDIADLASVKDATLRASCDNGAKVFLNGELVISNRDWGLPSQAEVRSKLRSGRNELRAEATNKGSVGAFIAALSLNGGERMILTDESWLAAAPGTELWQAPKIMGVYGTRPWGPVFDKNATTAVADDVIPPNAIQTQPGFKVELIHKVDSATQGSWVGLTVDARGRLIGCDQYGGLYRLTPPPLGSSTGARVEKLSAGIAGAHGILHAFDSLYVMVNQEPDTAGLWRLRDTDGDDQFDKKELLREIKGRGEHGNHSITLAPDGQSLYIACGNGTQQPQLEHTRGSRPFGDDQAVPRITRGAEFSDTEPQAFTCRVSPDGKRFEMVAAGLRNHYDIAFNALGDLFTYDSDMEWDAGTPWYRPTRIYHLVSGGDYGFRESSGKLLGYCADIVPPLVDVGPGSPTGVTSGLGAAFPAAYQHAIYACDWTYGTLYAVHLTPQGAGYSARLEEFLSGKPLPLTDAVIGKDGAMYVSIGGRRTQSAVYRITYAGRESTAAAPGPAETPEHKLRVQLEHLHDEGTGPDAIGSALPHLAHADRLVRYAARVAIERQPAELWAARALEQTQPWAVIEGGAALARMAGRAHQPALLAKLNALDFSALDTAQQLALIRVYQITAARSGVPADDAALARLDALYPAASNALNTELSRTLAAYGSSSVVAKTLQLMAQAKDEPVSWLSADRLARNDRYGPNFLRTGPARPNVQQIAYAYALRFAKNGWTPELRRQFFTWFGSTGPWIGGNQFRGFLDQMRSDALANVVSDPAEKKQLEALAIPKVIAIKPEAIKPPKGPGAAYTVEDVLAFAKDGLHGRNFKRGRELYIAAACQACHRLGNEGGGIGPDLTGIASRYTLRDLLENLITPSKVISDQYESTILELKDGRTLIGRITGDEGGILQLATNPAAPAQLADVRHSDITSRKPSPVSLMPPALINTMNQSEVLDLLAYLLSGGVEKGKMFSKK